MSVTPGSRPGTEPGDDSGSPCVWLRADRPQRADRPLSRSRIVAEAMALLDEEGIERLTMRRLAERLGTGSTTLYWHVATKDDVLDLTLDALLGEVPLPAPGGDWRSDLRTLLLAWRATLLRHPWSACLLGRPMLGPNTLARVEFLQAALVRAGLTGRHLTAATWALCGQVTGAATTHAAFRLTAGEHRAVHTHLWTHRDTYPALAAHGRLPDEHDEDDFAAGLDYLLDGIEAATTR